MAIRRAWDIQWDTNPWLSLGFHLDHTDPSVTLHLPGLIVAAGRLKQPGFRWGVRWMMAEKEAYTLAWTDGSGERRSETVHATDTDDACRRFRGEAFGAMRDAGRRQTTLARGPRPFPIPDVPRWPLEDRSEWPSCREMLEDDRD